MIDGPRVAPDAERGRGGRGVTAVPPDRVQGPGTFDDLERRDRPQAEGWPVGPVDRPQVVRPGSGPRPAASKTSTRAHSSRARSASHGGAPSGGRVARKPAKSRPRWRTEGWLRRVLRQVRRARRLRSARCPARRQSSRNPPPGRRAGARSTSGRRCPRRSAAREPGSGDDRGLQSRLGRAVQRAPEERLELTQWRSGHLTLSPGPRPRRHAHARPRPGRPRWAGTWSSHSTRVGSGAEAADRVAVEVPDLAATPGRRGCRAGGSRGRCVRPGGSDRCGRPEDRRGSPSARKP